MLSLIVFLFSVTVFLYALVGVYDVFTMIPGDLQDYFLLSSIFGIAGTYLLLRHYMKCDIHICMKKPESSGGGVVLLDAVKELVEVNGPEKVLNFIKLIDSAARGRNVTLLIARAGEFESILKTKIEYLKL
jgi:hypothetical protein